MWRLKDVAVLLAHHQQRCSPDHCAAYHIHPWSSSRDAAYVLQVRARDTGRAGSRSSPSCVLSDNILRTVEHSDLISYGLIPEFVGRLPILCPLQVRSLSQRAHPGNLAVAWVLRHVNQPRPASCCPDANMALLPLQELTESEMVQVLTEPRSALCKQYASLLAMSGTRLVITRPALRAIARQVLATFILCQI